MTNATPTDAAAWAVRKLAEALTAERAKDFAAGKEAATCFREWAEAMQRCAVSIRALIATPAETEK